MKYLVLLLSLLVTQVSVLAQDWCATDHLHNKQLATDAAYAARIKQQNQLWAKWISSGNATQKDGSETVYEIPVVFHIVHTGQAVGSPYNPSDDSLATFIDYLNKEFSATSPGKPDVNSGGVYVPVQFKIAKRNPNCGATTAINRVDGRSLSGYEANGVAYSSGAAGAPDEEVKNLSRWPNTEYINIWLVNKITGTSPGGGGIAGYATLPGGSPEVDGLVLRYDQVKWAITHELGHFFGLRHTFQGSDNASTCPPNTDCAIDGDMVCDTDPHALTSGCPTGTNSCANKPWSPVVYNIMNYSSCPNRFSLGQKERMIYMLENYRSGLITSLAAAPHDSVITQPSTPQLACTPGAIVNTGNTYDVGPSLVQLADINVSSNGYSGDGELSYIDRCISNCMQTAQTANLDAGGNYTITVGVGYNPENVRGWIDFNNNGVFEAAESIISKDGEDGVHNEIHSASFIVPTDAVKCTSLRMRIASDFYGSSAPTPCSAPQYGQAEDYIVTVGGGASTAPTLQISHNATASSCENEPIKFTASTNYALPDKTYLWYLNGQATPETDSIFEQTFTNNDNVHCRLTSPNACNGGDTVYTSPTTLTLTSVVTPPLVEVSKNTGDTICSGESVTFTSLASNAGTAPEYRWFKNEVLVGSNQSTYMTDDLLSTDVIRCQVVGNVPCAENDTAIATAPAIFVGTRYDTTYAVMACDSFKAPDNSLHYASGTIVINAQTTAGCDSLITINLTVNQSAAIAFTVTACNEYLAPDDSLYTQSTQIVAKLKTNLGCDSVVTIDLTITTNPSPAVVINTSVQDTICSGIPLIYTASASNTNSTPTYSWTKNGEPVGTNDSTYTNSQPENDDIIVCTVVGGLPCAANDTARATAAEIYVKSGFDTTYSVTACNSYLAPDDQTYITSQTIVINKSNAGTCDSVTTILLTVNYASNDTVVVNACKEYLAPDDSLYTASDTLVLNLTSSLGCDSILTMFINIGDDSDSTTATITACNSFLGPDNVTYTESDTLTFNLTNTYGCDSVSVVYLTIDSVSSEVVQIGDTLYSVESGALYQWLACSSTGQYTVVGNGPNYVLTQSGDYALVVTRGNCVDTSECDTYSYSSSISEPIHATFQIHPNPTDDVITIESSSMLGAVRLVLSDVSGRKLMETTSNNFTKKTVDLSPYTSGVYQLTLISEQQQTTVRLIKR